jgi:quercetin dioxygenase-like cupin family protein
MKKVVIPKAMAAGKHLHPRPVVGYIVSGKVLFQVDRQEKKILNPGEAFL